MNENNQDARGWLDTIAEGGLPQLLAGPAGKAISRLIGASVEIPAAWLEQKAQAIRDETEARSKVMQMLAEKSGELGFSDPSLLERGLNSLLGRAYREQENREAVAQKTIKYLADEPASTGSQGPSDDWMNRFEEYAAKASSEQLRETWARVLSGEIRKPGSFSLPTIQFLSVLDKVTAEAVEFTLARSILGQYVVTGSVRGEDLDKLAIARSAGIISQIDADVTATVPLDDNGICILTMGDFALVVRGQAGKSSHFRCVHLSRVGRELLAVIQPPASKAAVESLAEQFKNKPYIESVELGPWKSIGNQVNAYNLHTIWRKTGV